MFYMSSMIFCLKNVQNEAGRINLMFMNCLAEIKNQLGYNQAVIFQAPRYD